MVSGTPFKTAFFVLPVLTGGSSLKAKRLFRKLFVNLLYQYIIAACLSLA